MLHRWYLQNVLQDYRRVKQYYRYLIEVIDVSRMLLCDRAIKAAANYGIPYFRISVFPCHLPSRLTSETETPDDSSADELSADEAGHLATDGDHFFCRIYPVLGTI